MANFKDLYISFLDSFSNKVDIAKNNIMQFEKNMKSKNILEPEVGEFVVEKNYSIVDRVSNCLSVEAPIYMMFECVDISKQSCPNKKYANEAKTKCWKLVEDYPDISDYDYERFYKEVYFKDRKNIVGTYRSIFRQ